jgi:hypothetical protein
MTKKDYELIAKVLSDLYADFDCSPSEDTVSLTVVADNLADALQGDNARFNRETFLKACGVN